MKQILAKVLSDMQRDRGISLTSELHNSPETSQTNEEQWMRLSKSADRGTAVHFSSWKKNKNHCYLLPALRHC